MLLQTCVKYTFFIVICLPSVHGVTPAAKPPGRGMGKSRPGTADAYYQNTTERSMVFFRPFIYDDTMVIL